MYDALGRLVYAREGNHLTERIWDAAGVMCQRVYATDNIGHVDATWTLTNDPSGRLVDLVGPTVGGLDAMSATHSYDTRGRLSGITEATLGMFSFRNLSTCLRHGR